MNRMTNREANALYLPLAFLTLCGLILLLLQLIPYVQNVQDRTYMQMAETQPYGNAATHSIQHIQFEPDARSGNTVLHIDTNNGRITIPRPDLRLQIAAGNGTLTQQNPQMLLDAGLYFTRQERYILRLNPTQRQQFETAYAAYYHAPPTQWTP